MGKNETIAILAIFTFFAFVAGWSLSPKEIVRNNTETEKELKQCKESLDSFIKNAVSQPPKQNEEQVRQANIDQCLAKAETSYSEELNKRISGYNFLVAEQEKEYRRKAQEGGASQDDIDLYVSYKKTEQNKIEDELHARMSTEKELCIKQYKE